MTAIFFHRARQTLMVRNASDGETLAAIFSRKACISSGWIVFGSTSPQTGASHFHALGQSSRLLCSLDHDLPLLTRSLVRMDMARR
ncbi:hypothetical protein NVS89_22765 [Ancylobacter sp. MQZ15Z-1]|uniref:Uncharacterized protein n=1 Tax=Ancylobacter mangrovi TaxID=2972472 RepID=A0A9X2T969_9HYPH|nr:hypothetical protein [Ancylobacter mangrovi]MCS0497918.1 hypothetical protein [Ancylobacter mangrovi]